jgi:hypothetical protein
MVDERLTTAIWVLAYIAVGVIYDVQMFEQGAVATISQIWLWINQHCWAVTFVSAFVFGVCQQHVSVPRTGPLVQPWLPPVSFFTTAAAWTPIYWLGMYVAYLCLSQLPNQD